MNDLVSWLMNWLVWIVVVSVFAYALKWLGVYDVAAQSWGYWVVGLVAAGMAYQKPLLAG